jgi:urocanate hydratase
VSEPGTPATESARPYQPALLTFVERGAIQVDLQPSSFGHPGGFVEIAWTASSLADLRRVDELALQQLPADDSIRRRWLQQAPAYFHRQRPLERVLGMNSQEVSKLAEQLKKAISAGQVQSPATLHWQTAEGSKQSIAL